MWGIVEEADCGVVTSDPGLDSCLERSWRGPTLS